MNHLDLSLLKALSCPFIHRVNAGPKRIHTPNICRDLQGLCRGFLQYLQIAEIAGKICKYCRIFPADIAENPCRVPVILKFNPIKQNGAVELVY